MQLCTFDVGDLFVGVDVSEVQEVLLQQPMTKVPLAPGVVRGLINLRGQIVTAVELRRRLGLPDRQADAEAMNVIVHTSGGISSLLVDQIGDVVEVDSDAVQPSPATVAPTVRELMRGVVKTEDRLLLVLDVEQVVESGAEVAMLGQSAWPG